MSKTKTPTIKSTSVPSVYDTPMTTLEYLRKVEEQNAQVLSRADEIEDSLNGLHTEIAGVSNSKVSKSGDTMTGALNVPQVNADTGVFRHLNAVSQDGNTHVEVSNGGFIAEVTEETTGNKKYGVIAYPNGKVGFYAHDSAHSKDVNFIIPNMDEYEAGTYELATKDDIPEPSGGGDFIFSKTGSFAQSVLSNSHAILRLSRNMLAIDIKGQAYTSVIPTPTPPNGYDFVTFTFTEEEFNKIASEIDTDPYGNLCTGAFKYNASMNGLLYGRIEIDQSSRKIRVKLIGNTGEWPSTATGSVFDFDVECIMLGVTL